PFRIGHQNLIKRFLNDTLQLPIIRIFHHSQKDAYRFLVTDTTKKEAKCFYLNINARFGSLRFPKRFLCLARQLTDSCEIPIDPEQISRPIVMAQYGSIPGKQNQPHWRSIDHLSQMTVHGFYTYPLVHTLWQI